MLYGPDIPILDFEASEEEVERVLKTFSDYSRTYTFNGLYKERREYLEKAFVMCEEYLDVNFKNEIKLECNFFSRLWELQLCVVLLHNGYALIKPPVTKKPIARPDFCFASEDGSKVWIEAICPQLGSLRERPIIVPGEIYTRNGNILDELKLSAPRILSSTLAKYKKIEFYKNNPDFSIENDKFIIAINTELINHCEPADMAKELVLYGMGLMYIKQNGESGRNFHSEITYTNGNREVVVPTALFHKPEYAHISAVISSNCWFDFGDDFIDVMSKRINTYFNHNAAVKLNEQSIKFGTRHTMKCEGEYCELIHQKTSV